MARPIDRPERIASGFFAAEVLSRIAALDEVEVELVFDPTSRFEAFAVHKARKTYQIRLSQSVSERIHGLYNSLPASVKREMRDCLRPGFPMLSVITAIRVHVILLLMMHELCHLMLGHFGGEAEALYRSSLGYTKLRELEADGSAIYLLFRTAPMLQKYLAPDPDYSEQLRSFRRRQRAAMRKTVLFSSVLASLDWDSSADPSSRDDYSSFFRSRLVAAVIVHMQLSKPRTIGYDWKSNTILCRNKRAVLQFFHAEVLPVLQWCQVATDKAKMRLSFTEKQDCNGGGETISQTVLSCVLLGVPLGESAQGINELSGHLRRWYGTLGTRRGVWG
jgi:hypothetical protein